MGEHNLLMGRDVGFVGFDDIALLKTIGYEVTLMDRPMNEIGEIAYDLLMERMNAGIIKKRRREILVQTRLLIRGSERWQGGSI